MPDEIVLFADGWVFLVEGSNSVGDYYIRDKRIPVDVLDGWSCLLSNRAQKCSDSGIRYLHVTAPEKLAIYPEKSEFEVLLDKSPASQVERVLEEDIKNTNWLNPAEYLRSQKEHFKVYSKTDSHWNFYGAYSVYQLVQARLGLPSNTAILDCNRNENWTVMDLGGKYDPPLPEKVFYYTASPNIERTYFNEIVDYKEKNNKTNEPGLHTGSHVVFENKCPTVDQSVMLFGDSFSEYRLHLLTGMLAETYRTVNFVWSSNIDWDLVDQHKPDILITELAERFMPRVVPGDKYSLTAYVEDKMSNYSSIEVSS